MKTGIHYNTPNCNVPIKAIIFDFGGVLLEWDPRYLYRQYFPDAASMENFLEEVGFFEWNSHQDRGRSFEEGIADLSSRFPHYNHLFHLFFDRWIETIGSPITETIEIMHQVKEAGWPVYGLSNWSCQTFPLVRKKYTFFDELDDFLLSCDVKLVKPDPSIFRIFLDRIGRKAFECVFIDDSESNVRAAQALGFIAIRYQTPAQLRQELGQLHVI